jgi:Zn-dependent peptidase ImmA (M78 family)/transcriptional regulator with XRE-family HTH domain
LTTISGDRVKQARELRGLTQRELSEKVVTEQAAISQIENGKMTPSEKLLSAIAFQTGFPISFFRQPTSIEFPLGSLMFRTRTSIMTAKQRDMARQYGKLLLEIVEKLETHVNRLPLRLPRLSAKDTSGNLVTPSLAAQLTRSAFGLSPDTPIKHLINVLERNGIMVVVLPKPLPDPAAYSVWTITDSSRPVIVISGKTSGDRLRFSVAHELGHLVLHQSINDLGKAEDEANLFAGEFLVPEVSAREDITSPVTLTNLAKLKPKWRVSIQMLVRRACDLGIVTSRQYTYLMQQIGSLGWRTREPLNLDVPIEKPRGVHQAAEMIYGLPLDYKRIAEDMNISAQMAKEIFSAHTDRYCIDNDRATGRPTKVLIFDRKKAAPGD